MTDTPHPVIRVLVADDQDMVRNAFRFFLDAQPDMTVVAEAGNGREAVNLARRLRPDVCLMDIRMPLLDGLAATRELAGPGVSHPLAVVTVTTFDTDEYVYQALEAGSCGFILKDAGPTLLAEAVRAAARGDALVSPSITVRLLRHVADARATGQRVRPEVGPSPVGLTDREIDVARLVAVGRTNAEISAELFISTSTTKTHLTSIQQKLSVRNRVEIAAHAWRTGLVEST